MLKDLEKFNLPEVEEKVLKFWNDNKIFEKSISRRRNPKGKKRIKSFVFFEGPPTANGLPGTHHVLVRSFKDIILRYKTMRGFLVSRRAGWDTQGLPVEIGVEKELGLKNKQDIEEYGIAKFNKKAKESVWKYKEDWEKLTERIGYWLDFKNAYVTYTNDYLETLWWVFKQIDKRKLLKKSYRVAPYCTRCQTVLSSHELGQPGAYKLTKDPSVFVKLRITKNSHSSLRVSRNKVERGAVISRACSNKEIASASPRNDGGKEIASASPRSGNNEYLLIWTTTPWTLPANVAVAVNPKFSYRKFKIKNKKQKTKTNEEFLWSASDLPEIEGVEIEEVDKKKGKDLIGWEYKPLYKNKGSHQVYSADFVSDEEGTGLVHIAPAFGEDDFNLIKGKIDEKDIPITIDNQGKIIEGDLPGAGKLAKEADKDILEDLKDRNLLYYKSFIEHDYPFCWRCNRPLLYMARSSWFVNMSKLRSDLQKENKEINWMPSHIKEGRFGNWLAEVKDWAISRDRYWGTPLPIWECSKCEHSKVIGGLDELKEESEGILPVDEGGNLDLHRPYIDKVELKCSKCDKAMKRVRDVADVWFDSGAMPFAQWHYPFENKEVIDSNSRITQFPADYICEAVDQTRGWFYTLLAISVLLKRGVPYKNVISLGLIVDKNGQKMSKSKGNVINPWDLVNNYGADALRWYFYSVNQPGDIKKFNEIDLKKTLNKVFGLLYNSYKFYKTYGNKQETRNKKQETKNVLDKWILVRLNETTNKATKYLDKYEIYEATSEIERLIDDLSRWYIRRSRKRFSSDNEDAKEATITLHFVLIEISKLLAPFTPFFAEAMYSSLATNEGIKSVHLEDYPEIQSRNKISESKELLESMDEIRRLASLALAMRAEAGIKVRQPLASLKLKTQGLVRQELLKILADEINVKKIVFDNKIKNEVELNVKITPTLKKEGMLRELVRAVQGLRQKAGLNPGDRIGLYLKTDSEIKAIISKQEKKLKKEVGAEKITYKKEGSADSEMEAKLGEEKIWVGVKKQISNCSK